MAKGKPDDRRVDELLRTMSGAAHGLRWTTPTRHEVQQIVYIEESCRDLLTAISHLDAAPTIEARDSALREIKQELFFLRTLGAEKSFLRDL
jgi:hypothetical protein